MKRLRRGTRVLWVIAGLGIPGCFPAPRRVIFDPFATPFAVVETRGDQSVCVLPDDGGARWSPVPPASAPGMRQAAIANVPLAPRKFDGEPTGFCVYKWADPKTLPMPEDFARIHAVPDGAVVGIREYSPSKIPALPDSVWKPLLSTFETLAVDLPSGRSEDLAKRQIGHSAKLVKVAVLDTTPKGLEAPDRSLHGFAVSRVIGRILCRDVDEDGPECRGRVLPYLALPMVTSTKQDLQTGGLFGTFFQLYDALSQALREWRPNDEHLVINLSLGWDPIKTDENDPKVQRVRRLLERASCMGALIVASAGNNAATEGPIAPGAFEEYRAPNAQECQALGVQAPQPTKSKESAADVRVKERRSNYTPLVYAVGALDSEDQRLVSGRQWGLPRLDALGLDVTVPGPKGIPYTPPMSGSSIATAVVSGIAASVWSVAPGLDAAEVMDLVYKGGVELDGGDQSKRARTEFCLGEHFGPCLGPDRRVHRAFLCGALKQALAVTTPEEKLDCKPSVSAESPVWPSVPISGSGEICRVIDCGVPHGATSIQVAGVTSHGGFAGCPGCGIQIDIPTLTGTLQGAPSAPDPPPAWGTPMLAVLKTYSITTSQVQYYWLNPTPAFDTQMAVTMSFQSRPYAANLAYFYYVDGSWIQDPPPDGSLDGGGIPMKITK